MKISCSLSGFVNGVYPVGRPIYSNFVNDLIGLPIYADRYKTVGRVTEVDLENDRLYGEITNKEYEQQIIEARGFNVCSFEIVKEE